MKLPLACSRRHALGLVHLCLTGMLLTSCSTSPSSHKKEPSAKYKHKQEIHFSTSGSKLKPIADYFDVHTLSHQQAAETGTKSR
jgi:hypothetical protein